ncbi:Coupling of ubiquitin conjugation to ER degradation protein 1 [Meyerozyma sp. JA9]|nr:Coupling of ubiquitin conjugation to ER degradation protein 1 [Meyerozyma sp. JA9]
METSTVVFFATIVAGFLILRWLISPIPDPLEEAAAAHATNRDGRRPNPSTHSRRPVTDSMIDVVQAIAPQLTRAQIRMDLERSGSVEVTIDRFMEEGTLPMPESQEGEQQAGNDEIQNEESGRRTNGGQSTGIKPANLIERYGLESKIDQDVSNAALNSATSQDKIDLLSSRREEMILNARKRLAAQLSNEIDANPLM